MESTQLSMAAEFLQASFRPLLRILTITLPFLITTIRKLYHMWIRLPIDVTHIIIGLVFCFFGGLYPTLFAAIQAVKLGGWSTFTGALSDLSDEVVVVLEANKKDEKPDVKKMDEKELILRKLNLVMTKINPAKV